MLFSSRTASTASPGSPSSAKPGALRRGLASAALPRPPLPPAASTMRVPAPIRSATISPSTQTTVPSGTRSTRSSPRAPLRLLPAPGLPLPAFWCGRWWKSSRVCTLGSTSRTTSPPSPPLPPSGPPSGLYFSRWTEDTPCPPLPAATCTVTRSTNAATSAASCLVLGENADTPTSRRRRGARRETEGSSDLDRGDGHGLAAPAGAEGHRTRLEREQRVVAAAAHAETRVEVRAALPDDDLAGLHDLAAEALDAEPLGVGVAAVAGGRSALLVCHVGVSPS